MSAEEILTASERSASKLGGDQFVSRVEGKNNKIRLSNKTKSWGAAGFIVAMVALIAVLFSSGNIVPSTISERLVEETDVQYADAVESKKLVLQQALAEGDLPNNTAALLKERGVLVGYMQNGEFVEGNKSDGGLVLSKNGEIVTAENFIEKVNADAMLYNAINDATYRRAAGYYDETAREVFKKIGTNRNNYNKDSDLTEVMNKVMGSGSDVDINSVSLVQKTRENAETGETETYYEYVENGAAANSEDEAAMFVAAVGDKNLASSSGEATINSADTLKVADTMSKEQRSSLFYALFMENISKMKAGDGNESKINEAMNFLYEKSETKVVDVKTGEVIKVIGTALDSPSLYAVLAGQKVNTEAVGNYSSDRILKTVENQVGGNGGAAITSTVASSSTKVKGSIGRLISDGVEVASNAILSLVTPTVKSSLVDNSYDNIKGVSAGETLVEGAINVGKMLAKGSGATSGDVAAVESYARLNSVVLAMDAKADRMSRSPFDITSKNTFLGSIVYKFAVEGVKFAGIWSGVKTFSSTVNSAMTALLPSSYADEVGGYLTTFGDCETYATIGAVGSAQCAEIATFDTSTLNDPFNDAGFINFVNNNTTLDSSGTRKINSDSVLADFILYNDERTTPLGVVDGGILKSINNNSGTVSFLSNILKMVEEFIGATDDDKRVASGEAFVNSSNNTDWQTYKYAQRYVALARATAMLRQYSDDEAAYSNIRFFEGSENPVVAFLQEYYTVANN